MYFIPKLKYQAHGNAQSSLRFPLICIIGKKVKKKKMLKRLESSFVLLMSFKYSFNININSVCD